MRLLDRYLLRELLIPLGYCLGGFLIFWIAFDLFSELSDFQRKQLQPSDIIAYYTVKTPEFLVVVLPVALLLALLYALTNHARHHELTAIRAAGVSLWRLSVPYLAVGFSFSVALFAANEFWVPESSERAEKILTRYQGATSDTVTKLFFQNAREQRSWSSPAYDLQTHEMLSPSVVWELPDGSRRDIYAERAVYTNRSWTFYNVRETFSQSADDIIPRLSETNILVMTEFSENPELIKSEIKINNLSLAKAARGAQIPLRDILNYLRLHPELSPAQESKIYTQLHARLAAPWTCLIVVLIAIPFGAPSGRRNVFVGVASSIFICFAYFILLQVALSFGIGGTLPPWVAAWLPNLIFATAGIWMTMRVR